MTNEKIYRNLLSNKRKLNENSNFLHLTKNLSEKMTHSAESLKNLKKRLILLISPHKILLGILRIRSFKKGQNLILLCLGCLMYAFGRFGVKKSSYPTRSKQIIWFL